VCLTLLIAPLSTSVSYPPELKNHALVRFNGRKHHDVVFHHAGEWYYLDKHNLKPVEDPLERMLDHLDVWSRSADSEEILAHFTAHQFEHFERMMRLKGVPEGKDDWEVVERSLQDVVDREAIQITNRNIENRLQEWAQESMEASLTEIYENDKEVESGLFFDGLNQVMKKRHGKKDNRKKNKRVNLDTWFTNYHPHNEIKDFFLQLADDFPELVTFIPSIGQTVEGKDIFAVKITEKEADGSVKEKSQIWWQGL